jgi:hypothetical protein
MYVTREHQFPQALGMSPRTTRIWIWVPGAAIPRLAAVSPDRVKGMKTEFLRMSGGRTPKVANPWIVEVPVSARALGFSMPRMGTHFKVWARVKTLGENCWAPAKGLKKLHDLRDGLGIFGSMHARGHS